jgi:quercetin dioxygenase-like cupin family protein/DNA-binding XRE family transcriptional regulator
MSPFLKQQAVGEHVRRLRAQSGMSVRMLAKQAGFSPSFMSQVENGQVSPSISSMEKIAAAVGVTLGAFFAAVAGGEGGLVVRVADRQVLGSGWSDAEIEALTARGSTARLEAILITLRPGGRSGSHPYAHSREEFAFVLQGEVMLTLGPDEHRLRRGDAATILPGELRLWRNAARAPARILITTAPGGAPPIRGGTGGHSLT